MVHLQEFLDDGKGNVAGIRTCKVSWEKDDAGRWKMQKIPDSEKIFKADLVLLAMGFLGPEETVIEQLGLEKDPRSNIQSPKGKYRTSVPKVYAAGGQLFFLFFLVLSVARPVMA